MEASKEDTRKKRDSEVKEDAIILPPKKQRSIRECPSGRIRTEKSKPPCKPPKFSRHKHVWDLETAIHRLIHVGDGDSNDIACCESLAPDWFLRFRIGHAGDASTLSELYQNSKRCVDETNTVNNLDIRLSDALGNEDLPPSSFALIGELVNDGIHPAAISNIALPVIAVVAILVQGWENGLRVLQVEWLYVMNCHALSDLLERRMFLRLCTLAHMTSSDAIAVLESNTKRTTIQQDIKHMQSI